MKSSDGLRTSMGPMYFNAYIYYVLQRGPNSNPAVPRISFATRFAHIFAHIFATGNEFQKYFSARRNSFDLTQNSVKAVLTVSNLIMMRTYVFR